MKTAEEYLEKMHGLQPHDIREFRGDRLAEIMEEYATEQTAKWRELCEARKELINIDEELIVQNAARTIAGTGIYKIPEEIANRAYELRQKISEIEKELGLKE